jgi:hypothetical protein
MVFLGEYNAWSADIKQIYIKSVILYNFCLPGLILELDVNKGYMVYSAVKISDKIKPNSIKEPKGRRISMEAFGKERDKILEMEEMSRN